MRIQTQRRRAVQGTILDKSERIAMDAVHAGARLNVNGAASTSTGLGGKSMIDDLEIADGFGRKLRPAAACIFVVVVDSIQIDRVAPWPQPAEAKGAAAWGRALLLQRGIGRSNLGGEQNKGQIIAARNRQFLHAITVDVHY